MQEKKKGHNKQKFTLLKSSLLIFIGLATLGILSISQFTESDTAIVPSVAYQATPTPMQQQPTLAPPPVEPTLADYERLFVRATAQAGVSISAKIQAVGGVVIRAKPRVDTETVGQLSHDDTIYAMGQSADRHWIKVKDQDSPLIGWVIVQFVNIESDTQSLPIIGYPAQINAPGGIIVRELPFVDAGAVGQILSGDLVTAIGQDNNRLWVKIRSHDNPAITGWIFQQFVQVSGGWDRLPVVAIETAG